MVSRWLENPYYQHLTGEVFFQHRAPIDPSSLTRWRKRIGEEGVEWLLTKTIEAGRKSGAVAERSLDEVAVDTTVMEKTIAHPTDSRLYERARAQMVDLAREAGVELRESYARSAPRLAARVGGYAHARQFRRMRKALRTLKGYTGRVLRDLRRQLGEVPEGPLRERVLDKLVLVSRQLAPNAEEHWQDLRAARAAGGLHLQGQGTGAAHKFGCKVSIAATLAKGFVVGMRAWHGNPYDGHTLAGALEQVEVLTNHRPTLAVVDRGYLGHGVEWSASIRMRQYANSPRSSRYSRGHAGPDQWHPPRPDVQAGRRPTPTQRHRARDRPHEDRWPAVALLPQGHHGRRRLRRALRLRPQPPQDPRPPSGSTCRDHRRDPGPHLAHAEPPTQLRNRLIKLFRTN